MTSTVTMIVGDVRDVMARLPDAGFDFLVTSTPFLALRSYLPADHPDKHREIGSEPTPATFLDTLYGLSADWGRLLPVWASVAVELGDTMSGSGGAGGDYNADGLREGQAKFRQTGGIDNRPTSGPTRGGQRRRDDGVVPIHAGSGWPLAKSMCLLPHLYTIGLAYGHNPLTGQPHGAGQWRIRNVITWARPNPPVGSLGKRNPAKRTGDYKFRPACSFITVACRGTGRYFDLDAVRTDSAYQNDPRHLRPDHKMNGRDPGIRNSGPNPAGAPPLDWHTDQLDGDWLWRFSTPHDRPPQRRQTIIRRNDPRRPLLSFITVACRGTGRYFDLDAVRTDLAQPTTKYERNESRTSTGNWQGFGPYDATQSAGAPPLDWHTDQLDGDWLWKLATAPYKGAHYATYPLTLPRRLIQAMCPLRVCRECGWPSERMVGETTYVQTRNDRPPSTLHMRDGERAAIGANNWLGVQADANVTAHRDTLGWTDCRCPCSVHQIAACTICHNWRTGHVLDCFGGSGTTAVAAAIEGRDATLIDLDPRNVDLVRRRLTDHCRILDEQRDGDTIVWTVEPVSRPELDAIAAGQMELFE